MGRGGGLVSSVAQLACQVLRSTRIKGLVNEVS